mmetsp:Transcript_63534/g.127601  ORF Transcript_63534/g.127601 Transcript_63534/m.127601 type:complete len:208 (-) Transcript_63534:67-690(-)
MMTTRMVATKTTRIDTYESSRLGMARRERQLQEPMRPSTRLTTTKTVAVAGRRGSPPLPRLSCRKGALCCARSRISNWRNALTGEKAASRWHERALDLRTYFPSSRPTGCLTKATCSFSRRQPRARHKRRARSTRRARRAWATKKWRRRRNTPSHGTFHGWCSRSRLKGSRGVGRWALSSTAFLRTHRDDDSALPIILEQNQHKQNT